MTNLINDYVERVEFKSYEDFKNNFKLKIPKNFNFGFDIVDKYAEIDSEKIALIWEDSNEEHTFTFSDLKKLSNQAANYFKSLGLKKGDRIALILRNRYELWISLIALHKLGVIPILLHDGMSAKYLRYSLIFNGLKGVISIDDGDLIAICENRDLIKITVGEKIDGWDLFNEAISKFSDKFIRPTGDESTVNEDTFMMNFGDKGDLIKYSYLYPIEHILTAKYWQNVREDEIHYNPASTSAYLCYGSFYGAWICGSPIFVYDFERFDSKNIIAKLIKHNVSTISAPLTIYYYLGENNLNDLNLTYATGFYDYGRISYPVSDFEKKTNLKIKEGFGLDNTSFLFGNFIFNNENYSLGKPSPLFDIKLLDNVENLISKNTGLISIKLPKNIEPSIIKGYYPYIRTINNKLYYSNSTTDENSYFITNKIGQIDDKGFYHLCNSHQKKTVQIQI